ncbi:BON1-associated protein 2-like [Bidens hawaiensis]|uniref:BON1-associated protein 2-like n=1 Tax=Bidens hawaiensis TaxID=980011 RepID=UPI0040493C93
MEITIISAQGLKKLSFFTHNLQPFIQLTTTPPGAHRSHVYTTTVDHEGGVNPTWGDKFDLSNIIDPSEFFYNKCSCIYLYLYTNRVLLGPRLLGWCGIPVADFVDGMASVGTVRWLSYRLRKKDGSKGHGVVNVMVKLDSSVFRKKGGSDVRWLPEVNVGRVAIGIPVRTLPVVNYIIYYKTIK